MFVFIYLKDIFVWERERIGGWGAEGILKQTPCWATNPRATSLIQEIKDLTQTQELVA